MQKVEDTNKTKKIGKSTIIFLFWVIKEIINPILEKKLKTQQIPVIKTLIPALVVLNKAMIIATKVIGNKQYANKQLIWQIPIFPSKNLQLKVKIIEPIQAIIKTYKKPFSVFDLEVDNAVANNKQNNKGPHKSQFWNSSFFCV